MGARFGTRGALNCVGAKGVQVKRSGALLISALLGAAALSAPSMASAVTAPVPGDYTFTFTGTCGDCSTANATLTVQNYTLGQPLTSANLVDFHYVSNLTSFDINPVADAGSDFNPAASDFDPFVVDDGLSGAITDTPGHYDIDVNQEVSVVGLYTVGSTDFNSSSTAPYDWSVTETHANLDYGSDGTWNSEAASVSAAPEPGTWALLLGGVGILGAMLRVGYARRREDELKSIATA